MSHVVLYLPGQTAPDYQQLTRVGAGAFLREGDTSPNLSQIVQDGPDGGAGMFVHWGGETYAPGRYDWLHCGQYSLGTSRQSPPVPTDLQRNRQLPGREWHDAAGRAWLLPNVLALPYRFDLEESGAWGRCARAEYQPVQDRCVWACGVLKELFENKTPLPEAECLDFVCDMLSLNYRVNRRLCAMLGLYDSDTLLRALVATVDYEQIRHLVETVSKNG